MKIAITVAMTIILFSISLNATTKNFSHYYICEFNEEITDADISKLKKDGFQILNQDQAGTRIYIQSFIAKELSQVLTNKIKRITTINTTNTSPKEKVTIEKSPELFQLFFNFI